MNSVFGENWHSQVATGRVRIIDRTLASAFLFLVLAFLHTGVFASEQMNPLDTPQPYSGSNSPATLAEAETMLTYGLLGDAENATREYLSGHDDSADAHYLLGQILFTEQKPKDSLAEYTTGARYHVPDALDLKIVALDYVLLLDYIDADKWLNQSLAMNPIDSEAWYYLGRVKYSEERFEEAIWAFERCLQLDPHNIKAEDNLGLSQKEL